jgi:FkbM family methyltransferase
MDIALLEQVYQNVLDFVHLGFMFPVRHLASVAGAPTYTTKVRGAGQLTMRSHSSDAAVIRQVFRMKDYDFHRFPHEAIIQRAYQRILDAGQVPVIIDAGANLGASTVWFARKFPSAQVIAIEPEPANAALCRRNARAASNASVLEAALGAIAGRVSISTGVEDWAFQTSRSDDGAITVCTIPEVLDGVPNGRLFLVKIDIEGFESDVFSANTGWLDAADVVIIEPHDWMLPGQRSSATFQREMSRRPF